MKRIAILIMAITLQFLYGGFAYASESSAAAQQSGKRQVYGIVKDNTGTPIPGVTVMIPNTTIGTITDIDGRYSIDVPSETASLEVMSMGYATVTVTLGKSSVYDVVQKGLHSYRQGLILQR